MLPEAIATNCAPSIAGIEVPQRRARARIDRFERSRIVPKENKLQIFRLSRCLLQYVVETLPDNEFLSRLQHPHADHYRIAAAL